jgi:hypothetical protein
MRAKSPDGDKYEAERYSLGASTRLYPSGLLDVGKYVAEREGFEPSVGFLLQRFSKPPH